MHAAKVFDTRAAKVDWESVDRVAQVVIRTGFAHQRIHYLVLSASRAAISHTFFNRSVSL